MDDLIDLFENSFNVNDEYEELINNLNLIFMEKNINKLINILHQKNQFYYKNLCFDKKIKEQKLIKAKLEECLNINFTNQPYEYIKQTKTLLENIKSYIDSL
jgi:hypothetical protein